MSGVDGSISSGPLKEVTMNSMSLVCRLRKIIRTIINGYFRNFGFYDNIEIEMHIILDKSRVN